MVDRYFEARIENWARANRELPRAKKGATLVFCESLRYFYGLPEGGLDDDELSRPHASARRRINVEDANILDMAYRDRRITPLMRDAIRLFYVKRISPERAENIMHLQRKAFMPFLEKACLAFKKAVEDIEEAEMGMTDSDRSC